MSGRTSYWGGLAAERSVARHYRETGHEIAAERWRSPSGEIDLVARKGGNVIFVEVKKGRTHDLAAERLGARQIGRIFRAASRFLAGEPMGQLSPARFDVALVDAVGRIRVMENALCA